MRTAEERAVRALGQEKIEQFIAYQHALVQRLNEFNRTDETPEGLAERDRKKDRDTSMVPLPFALSLLLRNKVS